jgi:carboxypeptidase C (cathepsin A)
MKQVFGAGVAAVMASLVLAGAGLAGPAWAQDKGGDKPAAEKSGLDLPAFPADKSVKQTTVIAGKTIAYTATVGSLPVRDEKGKKVAEVVYTSYVLDGPRDPSRPITVAFNGGPGAASVYLNFALGPKRVQFGAEGDSPSAFTKLEDNPASWLDFTDLVFIDPVGTGFSRSLVGEEETKKRFYGVKQDIEYLSRIVFDYLVKTERLTSPKYLVGESYGGFRGPRLAYELQTDLGVAVKGVVLVSPLLTSAGRSSQEISPLPSMWTLPSIAAAKLERDGKLTPETIKAVEDYTRGEYMVDLMKGSDPAALDRLTTKVSAMTGLDPAYVRRAGGRLETQSFLREVFRDKGRLGSRYDSNVTSLDPFPFAPEQEVNDPILDAIIAPTTSAIVDFTTRIVGWKPEARYEALSGTVNRMWDRGRGPDTESVTDLRKAVSVDPKLKVLIVHGYNDLSCPFFASRLVVDAMPAAANGRVTLSNYPGGHMFYSRPDSGAAFRKDVMALYGAK